jgi:nucleotide-binding universal stress UspA family protein
VTSHGWRIGHLIADEAARWHADVMVMGTHGWHGFSHLLLGSEAETAIRAASMPVLLVRGEE